MTTNRSRRPLGVAIAVCAVLGALMALPALSSASLVGSLLERAGLTAPSGDRADDGASGAGRATDEQAGTPPDYTPPEHGTNPHGQGGGAVVDLTPEDTAPLGSEPDGVDPSEDVAVGVARGEEQDNGRYHGSIVLASLLGADLIQVETDEGETENGPLQPIQDLLDALCDGSSDQICLTLLAMDSETDANGSSNHFSVANADILGPGGVTADAIETNGNISESGGCQTSHGDSTVANAGVLAALNASVIDSSSDSESCTDGSTQQTNASSVVGLNGAGLALPNPGCEDGTPDSALTVLAPLAATVCNADDADGTQSNEPYGVREGLTAFVLAFSGSSLAKVTTAPSESQARPAGGDRDDDGIPDDDDACPNKPGPKSNDGCPPGDRDDDGIPDDKDACPNQPGPKSTDGCPDSDDDGIPDNEDACPQDPGPEKYDGCPDSDGDGLPDNVDSCPQDPGPDKYDGCPDSDGDGLPDNVDECPQTPGPESNNGCPLGGAADAGAAGGDGGAAGGAADEPLASTGSDLVRFALIALGLFALGMLGMGIADRRTGMVRGAE